MEHTKLHYISVFIMISMKFAPVLNMIFHFQLFSLKGRYISGKENVINKELWSVKLCFISMIMTYGYLINTHKSLFTDK